MSANDKVSPPFMIIKSENPFDTDMMVYGVANYSSYLLKKFPESYLHTGPLSYEEAVGLLKLLNER